VKALTSKVLHGWGPPQASLGPGGRGLTFSSRRRKGESRCGLSLTGFLAAFNL